MFWEKALVVMDYLGMKYELLKPQSLVERLPGLWLFFVYMIVTHNPLP